MSKYYAPNASMELWTAAWASNQVGTLRVRVNDNGPAGGVDVVSATTVGITWDGTRLRHQIDSLTAPLTSGEYTIIWDDGASFAYEDMTVTSVTSLSAPAIVGGNSALSDRIRRAIKDFPAKDVLFSSMDIGDSVITVSNPGVGYAPGQVIVVDGEAMLITSTPSGPDVGATIAVQRGWMGTTPALHNSSTPVLINVRFAPTDILDAMNEGVQMLWPYFFKMVEDTTITVTDYLQSDYTLPAAFGNNGLVTSMEILLPSLPNSAWGKYRWFHHRQGAAGRTLQLIRVPPPGTRLRLVGIAPFTENFDLTLAVPSAQMNDHAMASIVLYAKYYLKLVDEAQRQNIATAKNIGPAAVQGGQNSGLAQIYFQQWQTYCQSHAQRYPLWHTRRVL